jgi:transcription termination/antitermination protein NusA
MVKIVYDINLMKYMSLFEKITRARLKDCFSDSVTNQLVFVVSPGELGKAVGKKAVNVKKLENLFKKNIKIIEYADDLMIFITKAIYPLKLADIKEEDGVVTMEGPDTKTKGLLIGRNAANLRNLETVVKRYYPQLKEIKVI